MAIHMLNENGLLLNTKIGNQVDSLFHLEITELVIKIIWVALVQMF